MKNGNVDMSKLKLIWQADGHRMMKSASAIKEGDVVITVPENMLLTIKKVQETPLGKKI